VVPDVVKEIPLERTVVEKPYRKTEVKPGAAVAVNVLKPKLPIR